MINEANSLDLDDLDDIQDLSPEPVEGFESESDDDLEPQEPNTQNDDFDLAKELLTLQGISDMNKIKFEDESGAVIEKSWDSLSNNEKLMILSHQEDPDTSLDAAEIELINQIRESGMTPDQFIHNLQTPEPPAPTYEVDSMSDDELFCIDLLDKVGSDNITDEELQQALDSAKANEKLFSKQVASLRTYYKDLEDKRLQQIEKEKQEEAELEFENFSNSIIDSIRNFNVLEDSPVELSPDEMEDLANYILTRDNSGYSEFGRLLNDPAQFTKAAFWMLKGPEILNEMQKQIKEAYLRGYNEGNKPAATKKVFTKTQEPSTKGNNNKESWYANFDEDSYLK
jgi:hypothetical protein